MKLRGIFLSNRPDTNELPRACLEEKCLLTQFMVAGSFRSLLAAFLVTADTSLRVSFIRKLKERLPWVNRWVLGFYLVLFHICHLACARPEIFGRTLHARAARKYQETGDGQNRHCMKVAFLSFKHGYFSFYYVFRSSVNNGASKADRLGRSPHVSGHDADNRNGLAFPCFRCIAPIGEAKLYVFNADGADAAGVSMCDMCHGRSQTTCNCGEAVYNLATSVNEFRPAVQRIFDIDPWESLNVLLLAELKAAVVTISTLTAHASDLLYGPGGYHASLDRLGVKGSETEQQEALVEATWMKSNEAHIRKLLSWVQGKNQMRRLLL
jgi:hypothetical protein